VGELLLRKALSCRNRIVKLRAALPAVPEDILRDERLEAFVSFQLFLLIQDVIDLAAHLIAARGLGLPGSHRESFESLHDAGLIDATSASEMAALASLRNRIAHTYGTLDPARMAREAPVGLQAVERFLDQVTAAVTEA
jgi:uncharacterized protein YutE (UPF0331/DUF86 family)